MRKMILILPYAFGIMQEVEAFEVRLFEEFMEHPKMRATNLVIRIHGDPLNVNQAALRFTVKLSGMR